jgi:hypothetical protein
MVIKASSSSEIRRLVDALSSADDVQRETAIARLSIIGPRAVDRLIAAYNSASERDTRIAVMRTLESIGDRRMIVVARKAIAEGSDEAIAAAAALRGLLNSTHAQTAADALDTLVSVALDTTAEQRLRLAAFTALQELPADVRAQVAVAGGQIAIFSPDPENRDPAPAAVWADALEGRLPDDPALIRDLIRARGGTAGLSELLKLIDLVRAREQSAKPAARRAAWQALRGSLHQALALRGSRIALYDLRETLEGTAAPLPASFLAALHVIGDSSCLPLLAEAHARAVSHPAWRQQVAAAFQAIAKRERISKRHAVMKRIASKWPDILAEE